MAKSREASLRQSIEGVVGSNSQANRSLVDLRELEQRATALKTLYESYLGRYEEAAQQRSFPIAKARIISDAGVPVIAVKPEEDDGSCSFHRAWLYDRCRNCRCSRSSASAFSAWRKKSARSSDTSRSAICR